MTISFIGADSANATSIAIPAHIQWDAINVWVYRNAVATQPTIPAGWTMIGHVAGSSNGIWHCAKLAQSASEVSGTWTNADHIVVGVYRSDTNMLRMSNTAGQSGTIGSGGSVAYPIMNGVSPVTNKWLLSFFGHRSIDTDIEVAPTGMTNRTNVVGGAAGECGLHDTNGNYSSWPATSYVLTAGTSSGYKTLMSELSETGILLSSLAGGGVKPLLSGFSQQGVSIF